MEKENNNSMRPLEPDEIQRIEEFRKSKNTAILSILFSDIVNSTLATESLGEQSYLQLKHIHDELFTTIMTRDNAGIIIKEIGDSFLCVFAEPSTAVLRAIEFQRTINSNKQNLTCKNYTLTVRIGINLGQVAVENNISMDIFGRHVNKAARIMSISPGGQVLTSQSIWDNVSGWLKDHNELNIGFISYGKARLKGIEEKVDVFGFYAKESGHSIMPEIFKHKKRKKLIIWSLSVLFLASILTLLFFRISDFVKSKNQIEPQQRYSYYVHFDFSGIAEYIDGSLNNSSVIQNENGKLFVDTKILQENLLAQIINVFYPDSVLTDSDLTELFEKNGKLFKQSRGAINRHLLDSLKFAGMLYIAADMNKNGSRIIPFLWLYFDDSTSYSKRRDGGFAFSDTLDSDIVNTFRNHLKDLWLKPANKSDISGNVLDCNDSIVLFQFKSDSKLQKGAIIDIYRSYFGKERLIQHIEDVKREIDYYKNAPADHLKLEKALSKYKTLKKNLANGDWGNVNMTQLYERSELIGKGKVIAFYDSTGKARLIYCVPWNKPKKGDDVGLSY